jgi:nitrate reductase delta subunit
MMQPCGQTLLEFGLLLDYPSQETVSTAQHLRSRLERSYPTSARQIQRFVSLTSEVPVSRLEELYTSTFDLNPSCYIFAGYLLFGETFKRGAFMARLKSKYRERGFDPGRELPDHMALMLRFLATLDPEEELYGQIVTQCMVPAVQKMIAGFSEGESARANPYLRVLNALLGVLKPDRVPELAS